ncbi:MAG: PHP domain-containing protein [Thermoanaerobaculia bacterium]
MERFGGADLHCHSVFSDGLERPAALVERAVKAGLSALALSDHDAVHGVAELEAASAGTGLIPVPATELSTRCNGQDVHLLGLFVDPEEPALAARLAEMRRDREVRGEAMVEKLATLGLPLDLAVLRRSADGAALGRPHVARAMVAAGYVSDADEAFQKYLTKGKPGYVAKPKWTLAEAIAAVRTAGGLAVIAHPIWYDDPERIVAQGVEAGLDGLEVLHTDHNGAAVGEFARLADRYRLLRSAGSDFHGTVEPGKGVGTCRLGEAEWDLLVSAAVRRRADAGRPPVDLSPR